MSKDFLQAYKEAFAKAEVAVRFAELSIHNLSIDRSSDEACCERMPTPSGVVVPAINELRYSAKHMIDALSLADKNAADEQMRRAIRHCERARFDALRATVLFFIRDFRQFSEDYRMIADPIEGAEEHRKVVEETLDFLCADQGSDSPDEGCKKLQDAVDRMRPFFMASSSVRGQLNQVLAGMEQHKTETRQDAKDSKKATIWFTVLGIVVGYLLSFLRW